MPDQRGLGLEECTRTAEGSSLTGLKELDYVPLVPWYCTVCLCSGHIERSLYRWQTVERAYSAHAIADPECAARPEGHKYVFVEEREE